MILINQTYKLHFTWLSADCNQTYGKSFITNEINRKTNTGKIAKQTFYGVGSKKKKTISFRRGIGALP